MFKVEGLPDGWAVKEVHIDPDQHYQYVGDDGCLYWEAKIKVEKIQPRRIVLEETGEIRKPEIGEYIQNNGNFCKCHKPERWGYEHEIWREVKETDSPLTNEVKMGVSQGDGVEPNLELSVKELRNVRSLIKDFENLGWFINPERALLLQKITEFIKDK